MSGDMTSNGIDCETYMDSQRVAQIIKESNFSQESATVIGYGQMGRQYVAALISMGVSRIRVCSRSAYRMKELETIPSVSVISEGIEKFSCEAGVGELAIIATPYGLLKSATQHMFALGFRNFLIEKPISLRSSEILELSNFFDENEVTAVCGYNRLAYPSFIELRARAEKEGGFTSCSYSFTEMVRSDWTDRFTSDELARWGIANSLHPISMAHGLIGLPVSSQSIQYGGLPWHPTGSIFVGSGVSQQGVPFSYHADWNSQSRWFVEVYTTESSYRLCPLEKLYHKGSPLEEWEELSVMTFDEGIKAGIVEQLAALFLGNHKITIPLANMKIASELTSYAEEVFGYD